MLENDEMAQNKLNACNNLLQDVPWLDWRTHGCSKNDIMHHQNDWYLTCSQVHRCSVVHRCSLAHERQLPWNIEVAATHFPALHETLCDLCRSSSSGSQPPSPAQLSPEQPFSEVTFKWLSCWDWKCFAWCLGWVVKTEAAWYDRHNCLPWPGAFPFTSLATCKPHCSWWCTKAVLQTKRTFKDFISFLLHIPYSAHCSCCTHVKPWTEGLHEDKLTYNWIQHRLRSHWRSQSWRHFDMTYSTSRFTMRQVCSLQWSWPSSSTSYVPWRSSSVYEAGSV